MLATPLLIISTFLVGTTFGYFMHLLFSKKQLSLLLQEVSGLKKRQAQMQQDYNILLQAMEGAKAQAEEFQRKLYGTNVVEIDEPEDAEKLLNRKLLANFVHKKLSKSFAKSDKSTPPGDTKALESINQLDDRIVKILAQAVK